MTKDGKQNHQRQQIIAQQNKTDFCGAKEKANKCRKPHRRSENPKKKPQIPVDTPGWYSFPDQYTIVAAIRTVRYMARINSIERTTNLRMRLAICVRDSFIEKA